MKYTEQGNVLFLILLAVVLFAALSYAVSNAIRGDGKSGGAEASKAAAANIMQNAFAMEKAIERVKLVNGCADNQISFENPVVTGYTNASTPSDGRCKIFDPAGGGLTWMAPPKDANDGTPYFYRTTRVYQVGVDWTFCASTTMSPPLR